jgi:hypothetical protein
MAILRNDSYKSYVDISIACCGHQQVARPLARQNGGWPTDRCGHIPCAASQERQGHAREGEQAPHRTVTAHET